MMEPFVERILIYSLTALLCIAVVAIYLRKKRKESQIVDKKIKQAKEDGLHEPISLHPVVDTNSCIQTGACIAACPEHDILGIRNGKATLINASQCIGHGACFHACPTEAISLRIGTEKRGVELPHVSRNFETNVPGIFIAGELGGMGLIKNAVEQGRQAVDNVAKAIRKNHSANYDLIIVGAGPAGISGKFFDLRVSNRILRSPDFAKGIVDGNDEHLQSTCPPSMAVVNAPDPAKGTILTSILASLMIHMLMK